ncbi:uncharacterized protein LOC142333934 [Lycorma delicatula]|uniref:uncharacterized protein LOC142333934 n=1 Tax=Lycorma delicatula TaxID=130591 RepID=UPI003F51A6F1
MKYHILAIFLIFLLGLVTLNAAPTPASEKTVTGTANKGAFNPAFDEIVVESSLTVRGKSPGPRQGRKLVVIPANENITVKTSLTDPSSTTAKASS